MSPTVYKMSAVFSIFGNKILLLVTKFFKNVQIDNI